MARECNDISPIPQEENCCCHLSSQVCFEASIAYNFIWNGLETIEFNFLRRARRIVHLCAGQTVSAEAAALLRYLEQMWITVAEVAEIVEKNKSHQPLGDDPSAFVARVIQSRAL
jgi:hypothetical protein